MTSQTITATITYTSVDVDVSDDRGSVAGQHVDVAYSDGRALSGDIIPPEGPDQSAWLGGLAGVEAEVVEALLAGAEEAVIERDAVGWAVIKGAVRWILEDGSVGGPRHGGRPGDMGELVTYERGDDHYGRWAPHGPDFYYHATTPDGALVVGGAYDGKAAQVVVAALRAA